MSDSAQNPVDLANLRTLTDGDSEMEKMLFEEFITSFEQMLTKLRQLIHPSMQEEWRKQSHALKGIALNLGAMTLGELCKQSQQEHLQPDERKAMLLEQITAEYSRVKQYLDSLI